MREIMASAASAVYSPVQRLRVSERVSLGGQVTTRPELGVSLPSSWGPCLPFNTCALQTSRISGNRLASEKEGCRYGSLLTRAVGDKDGESRIDESEFTVGSPVVLVELPPFVKTAEPMPRLMPNNGILKIGDAGRVIDRRPKGLWAVRFPGGSYLVERRYFQALEL